ncbi:MAG: PGF-pre-PGF domain-containing protein, partial [Methanosarcinaceae archaeon]|nr:PGF-pre-PGF domain-containing protein [Methanosarcinaceae archaeon]
VNDSASTLNTLPPSSVTGLSESAKGSTWITWTWTNPADVDLNHTMIYLNGTFMNNVTGTSYNVTGLADNSDYELQTRTVDTADNINSTWVNDSASTLNTLPPSSVTGLSESTNGYTWINWTWTNPADDDLNHTMIYLNGTFMSNVTGTSYNASGLTDNTDYELQTKTVDTAGNINSTWINDSASTDATTSSGSSDTSGSRASVGQSQLPQNVVSTDSVIKTVLAGTTIEYDLSGGEGSVLGISFDAESNEGNVVTNVQVLNQLPDGVKGNPSDSQPFQTMSITVGSEGTISDRNADNILIRFKVSREWIADYNIDPSTIRMTRYHDLMWNDLPTNMIDQDDEYLYFTARTPGFSIFQVTGDEFVEETEPLEENESEPVEEEVPEVPDEDDTGLPGFTAGLGIVVIGLAGLLIRLRK